MPRDDLCRRPKAFINVARGIARLASLANVCRPLEVCRNTTGSNAEGGVRVSADNGLLIRLPFVKSMVARGCRKVDFRPWGVYHGSHEPLPTHFGLAISVTTSIDVLASNTHPAAHPTDRS